MQKDAYDSAINTATKIAESEENILIYITADKICAAAYKNFAEKLKETFPHRESLVSTALDSGRIEFYIRLKDNIIFILKHKNLN